MAVGDELDELERAGADRLELERIGVGVLGRHDHDRHAERAQILEEGRLRRRHLDHEGRGIGRLPARDVAQDHALDADRLVAVERGRDVGRGHRLAVVELDAVAQREGVDQPVVADVDRLGELEDRVVVLVAGQKCLEHVHRDVAGRDRRARVHVEAVDLGFLAEHQIAARDRAFERGLRAAAGEGDERARQHQGAEALRADQAHGFPSSRAAWPRRTSQFPPGRIEVASLAPRPAGRQPRIRPQSRLAGRKPHGLAEDQG